MCSRTRSRRRGAGQGGRTGLSRADRSVCRRADDDILTVTVEDNGIGLPQDRERIVEPYVTTREKGTGLGPRDRQQDRRGTWRRHELQRGRQRRHPRDAALCARSAVRAVGQRGSRMNHDNHDGERTDGARHPHRRRRTRHSRTGGRRAQRRRLSNAAPPATAPQRSPRSTSAGPAWCCSTCGSTAARWTGWKCSTRSRRASRICR